MRLVQALAYLALAVSTVNAVSVPEVNALQLAENARVSRDEILSPDHALEKRKGGGGRGGGGGGGRGSRGGGGASSRTSPTSMSGGRTSSGSGPPRRYGGGFYGGGAAVPYQAGGRTPKGLAPGLLLAPAAVLLLMPGLWLYSVYPYHYSNPYRFRNATRNSTETNNNQKRQEVGVEQELPVVCLCQELTVCGCDENDDPAYLDDLVGNGSYAALNKTLVTVSDVNGTETLVINGTLPNGTTAPGGTDDGAAAGLNIPRYAGYWVMVSIVLSIVTLL